MSTSAFLKCIKNILIRCRYLPTEKFFYFTADSRRIKTTENIHERTTVLDLGPTEEPSTDSWDEALGFNKIQIVDPIIDPTRGYLDEKYYCKKDGKRVRKGFHYFEYDNCLVWHCPKWPIPVGVYDFVFYK